MNTVSWMNEAMFYHIYPLGFTGASRVNEGEATAGSRILKVLEWIPHLKEIGINAVYFGPVFESLTHGYDTSDYFETDRRLGTKKEFKQVFDALHENGIRVVLDGVFNHVGRGFWAFRDVQEKGEASPYKDWFSGMNFGWGNSRGDNFSYDTWQGHDELVKLNLYNPAVTDHLLSAVGMWMEEFKIDGLRLDAADCVEKDFFKKLRRMTKEKDPDFWLMGEIIHGNYRDWVNEEMLDSVTNYECWKGIYSSHNDRNYFEIAHSLKRQFGQGGIYEGLTFYNFLDNHDVNRIYSLLRCPQNIENAYTILYMMPGVPSVYYGSEWGIEGVKNSGYDADAPLRPCLELSDWQDKNPELIAHIRKLAQARKTSKAVQSGSYEDLLIRNEQLVFARRKDGECTIAALNLAEYEASVQFFCDGQNFDVHLAPYSSVIFHNGKEFVPTEESVPDKEMIKPKKSVQTDESVSDKEVVQQEKSAQTETDAGQKEAAQAEALEFLNNGEHTLEKEIACRLLKRGKLSVREIAEDLGLRAKEVELLARL